MSRLRRIAPHVVGLGAAILLLWRGGVELERRAEAGRAVGDFALEVAEPAPVLVQTERAGGAGLEWSARVEPAVERERVQLRLDDRPLAATVDPDSGAVALELDATATSPGWHFLSAGIERRGGRRELVVDPLLVGDFAAPTAKTEGRDEPACALSLQASPALVERLLLTMLERELLPKLQANEHMGPEAKLQKAKLELRDDALRFELELAGLNTLAVSGVIAVWLDEDGALTAKLVTLSEVEFTGKLRNQARGAGAGGGALIGGLVAPPLAPIGAAAGWLLADKLVSDKARALIREQIDAGLQEIAGLELLPDQVALIPDHPDSAVTLGFCQLTRVRESGVVAGLWIQPVAAEVVRFDLGVPGPLRLGTTVGDAPLAAGEDLRLELGLDVVNALLTRWTETGLVAELVTEQHVLHQANRELSDWTTLRLDALRPTRPLVLVPVAHAGASAGGEVEPAWGFGFGGLALDLRVDSDDSRDAVAERWGQLHLAAAGTVAPVWDPVAGTLSLQGSLDRLDLTCVRPSEDPERVRLEGCFSELLEGVDLRRRLDDKLRPGAASLPTLALRQLLADELALDLQSLRFAQPQPGVLRVSAGVVGL